MREGEREDSSIYDEDSYVLLECLERLFFALPNKIRGIIRNCCSTNAKDHNNTMAYSPKDISIKHG